MGTVLVLWPSFGIKLGPIPASLPPPGLAGDVGDGLKRIQMIQECPVRGYLKFI